MDLTPPLDDGILARLIAELADAVVVADAAGTICFWNAAAERTFGWSATEAVGASLDLIIPERQRERHWAGYREVMATGDTKYGSDLLRVPSLHSDGERHSIAFTVTSSRMPTARSRASPPSCATRRSGGTRSRTSAVACGRRRTRRPESGDGYTAR